MDRTLGRLGVRQPDVYGKQDLETLRSLCTQWGEELGLDVEVRQSDDEAEMIGWMHQAADEKTPIVMNPAAFTHYSYGLADAVHMVIDEGLPLMEVHISNPSARDEFRKRSVISPLRPAPSPAWASTAISWRWKPWRICWKLSNVFRFLIGIA